MVFGESHPEVAASLGNARGKSRKYEKVGRSAVGRHKAKIPGSIPARFPGKETTGDAVTKLSVQPFENPVGILVKESIIILSIKANLELSETTIQGLDEKLCTIPMVTYGII